MMITKFYTPHVLLQDFIQCIMVIHAEIESNGSPVICPYPPAPQDSLFFYINDRIKVMKSGETEFVLQPQSVIVGPMITRVMLDINKSHKAVRVGFHPGGLHRFLGLSMADMIDGHFDAVDIYGSEMEDVNSKLQEAQNFDGIKDVIESFLIKKANTLKKALPFDKAMLELMRTSGNMPMDKVASLACLSIRQFERISKERIGITPKFFARLIRFSKAYRMRENFPQMSWTSIAHDCGYFDQMHLIHDFKQFASVAPGIIERDLEKAPVRLQAELRI